MGLSDDERVTIKRDFEALKLRLAKIPEEKAHEAKVIAERYMDFNAFTFPAAVVFVVPESSMQELSA